ncbi:MAG: hypothetical protein ACYDER_16450 [Ktedonobacteraceae bacterium]
MDTIGHILRDPLWQFIISITVTIVFGVIGLVLQLSQRPAKIQRPNIQTQQDQSIDEADTNSLFWKKTYIRRSIPKYIGIIFFALLPSSIVYLAIDYFPLMISLNLNFYFPNNFMLIFLPTYFLISAALIAIKIHFLDILYYPFLEVIISIIIIPILPATLFDTVWILRAIILGYLVDIKLITYPLAITVYIIVDIIFIIIAFITMSWYYEYTG